MDKNSYEEWQIVAEQYAAQVKLYADHIESWSDRFNAAGLPDATKTFERAVLALDMAYNELLKARDILHAEHDHDHFHVETFNVGPSASEIHDHDHNTDGRTQYHPPHDHAHPHAHA
ncbi:hypothetical protein [Sulfobacillus thermosulfidooxidans]|uniref:hypothetical protein n=1 Tax=Sulfobacillus thermosulfidooxidans TaxID=28034 RepID=UPI0006B4E8B6|nr:hypothetical protein [Sulfobacillus thermosulfidooxidans]